MSDWKTTSAQEEFILSFLQGLNDGSLVPAEFENEKEDCGDRIYHFKNNITLVVFCDCDDFDYIEKLITPTGVFYSFPLGESERFEGNFFSPALNLYTPSKTALENLKWEG